MMKTGPRVWTYARQAANSRCTHATQTSLRFLLCDNCQIDANTSSLAVSLRIPLQGILQICGVACASIMGAQSNIPCMAHCYSLQWPLWMVSYAAMGISQSISPRWSAANTITRAEPDTMASYSWALNKMRSSPLTAKPVPAYWLGCKAWLQASICMIANFVDSPKTLQQC